MNSAPIQRFRRERTRVSSPRRPKPLRWRRELHSTGGPSAGSSRACVTNGPTRRTSRTAQPGGIETQGGLLPDLAGGEVQPQRVVELRVRGIGHRRILTATRRCAQHGSDRLGRRDGAGVRLGLGPAGRADGDEDRAEDEDDRAREEAAAEPVDTNAVCACTTRPWPRAPRCAPTCSAAASDEVARSASAGGIAVGRAGEPGAYAPFRTLPSTAIPSAPPARARRRSRPTRRPASRAGARRRSRSSPARRRAPSRRRTGAGPRGSA